MFWCKPVDIHSSASCDPTLEIYTFIVLYVRVKGRKVKLNFCSGSHLHSVTDAEYIYREISMILQVAPLYHCNSQRRRRIICKGVSQGQSIFQ